MNWPKAIGFCLVGLGMLWLPSLAPGLCTSTPAGGGTTRELWLLFMGTVNTSLGAGVLGWHVIQQGWHIPIWLEPVAPLPAVAVPPRDALPQPSRL